MTGRKWWGMAVGLLMIQGTMGAALAAAPQDTVATVNGREISAKILDLTTKQFIRQWRPSNADPLSENQIAELKKQILDQIIVQELIRQEAEKYKDSVTDAEVEFQISRIQADMTQKGIDFDKALAKEGMTMKGLKAQIRKQMSVDKLFKSHVSEILDQEIVTYYEEHNEQFHIPEKRQASHILVEFDRNPVNGDDKAKAKIEEIKKALEAGKDFTELAREFSDCPSGKNGGGLGFLSKEQMVPAFSEAAFALDVGQVSDVVKTQFGYHLIKVTGSRAPEVTTLDQATPEIRKSMRQTRRQAYINTLEKAADIQRNL